MSSTHYPLRYSFIRAAARDIRQSYDLNRPPTAVDELLRKHALVLMDVSGQDGWTIRNGKTGHYGCFINLTAPPNRVRWTMAHELGHIVLGHIDGRGSKEVRPKWMEREANIFAEELLLPWDFCDGLGYPDLPGWAEHFAVSQEACARRLLQVPRMCPTGGAARLGLSEAAFTSLMQQCSDLLETAAGHEDGPSIAPTAMNKSLEVRTYDAVTVVGQLRQLHSHWHVRPVAEEESPEEDRGASTDGDGQVPF